MFRSGFGTTAEQLLQLQALFFAHDIELDKYFGDVRHFADRSHHAFGDGLAHRAAGDSEVDTDLDFAAGDFDALEHADLGDRAMDLRVLDGGEGSLDGGAVRRGHVTMLGVELFLVVGGMLFLL